MDLVRTYLDGSKSRSEKITLAGKEIAPVGIRRERQQVNSAGSEVVRYFTDARRRGKLFFVNANSRINDLTAASRRQGNHWI